MPYDLHIVRTPDLPDTSSAPITKSDVDALIASDPELAWSTTDYVDMRDDAEVVTRYWMIEWQGQSCFWWYLNEIQCSRPNEAQISKLVQMARALGAYVVGDDGETNPLEQISTPAAQPPTVPIPVPAKRPWPLWKRLTAAFLFGCVLLALKLLTFGH